MVLITQASSNSLIRSISVALILITLIARIPLNYWCGPTNNDARLWIHLWPRYIYAPKILLRVTLRALSTEDIVEITIEDVADAHTA
jgi:hypothetical protein